MVSRRSTTQTRRCAGSSRGKVWVRGATEPCEKNVIKGERRWVIQMATISIEVRSGAARFAVAVQARSLQQALDIVATRFPGNAVTVKPPIDQEGSSAEAFAV